MLVKLRTWKMLLSLSARRAWIEIVAGAPLRPPALVALRKESVDRNSSPPIGLCHERVALRKESVDRNAPDEVENYEQQSRSPQGERG